MHGPIGMGEMFTIINILGISILLPLVGLWLLWRGVRALEAIAQELRNRGARGE